MYRQSIIKAARPALRLQSRAAFTTATRSMAGETGAPRDTGAPAQGDAFQKREKANEDYTIRQRENQKLLELRKRLAEQHDHLRQLEKHIDEIAKSSGGEQN